MKNTHIIYLSHGGGPLPLLGDPSHIAMVHFMKKIPTMIKKPKAIVVFSAHWEESAFCITSSEKPELIYDYYGFPQESYKIEYHAKGNSELSKKIFNILESNNIKTQLTEERGFDHGVFIPLKLMYPEADIPVIAISLLKGLDPELHIKLGNALRALAQDDILFMGSGFSFHNMREFSQGSNEEDSRNNDFQDSLIEICTNRSKHELNENLLIHWKDLPHAHYCHPREEHLIPLHICFGLAHGPGKVIFDDYILGKRSLALHWEN